MSVTLELKADQLVKKFDSLTAEVQQAMIDELRVTGFMIESAYKIGVPVDTGRLRSSIHTEHSDQTSFSYSDSKGNTFNGSLGFKLQPTQVVVGTNVIYAPKIEYQGGKTKGKGALLTAFEAETKGLPQRLAELIK
jgi:ribosomal protein L13E